MRVTARELATKHRPRPRRERDVQAAILLALRSLPGVVAWKSGAGAFRVDGRFVKMGHRGVSDIVGFLHTPVTFSDRNGLVIHKGPCAMDCNGTQHVARFLAIEVKAKGQQPTDEQRAFLDAVQAAGGIALVAYSVDDVLAALR